MKHVYKSIHWIEFVVVFPCPHKNINKFKGACEESGKKRIPNLLVVKDVTLEFLRSQQ